MFPAEVGTKSIRLCTHKYGRRFRLRLSVLHGPVLRLHFRVPYRAKYDDMDVSAR